MRPDALRLVVADDEPLARELIRQYVRQLPDLEIVGECGSGDELAGVLPRIAADVLMLDVQMPGTDVFTVLEQVAGAARRLPDVIFSTAYDRYAVRAFELNAVDYLVKPYTAERFAEALRRVRSRHDSSRGEGLSRLIRDLGPKPDRLLVPDGRRMVPVPIADIVWVKAEDDYVRVHANGKSYLITRTLKDLELRLDPERFLRLHRSALVQASHIREVQPQGSSRYRVLLSDGTTVIVSRTRAPELKRWML